MARKITKNFTRKRRPFDPFDIKGRKQTNKSYQWVAHSVFGCKAPVIGQLNAYKQGGWRPVPPARHPKMPRRGRYIVVDGQVLMWRDKSKTDAAQQKETQAALSMLPEAAKIAAQHGFFGYIGNIKVAGGFSGAPRYPYELPVVTVDTDFVARLAAARTQLQRRHDVQFVDITVGFTISDSEVETAVHLRIDPIEYARRRVIMRRKESTEPVVLSEVVPGVFEFANIAVQRSDQ